ncbi:MAG: 50S ribosomal protein L25/general stress protein Ctc [Oscillospiraceae bacterium]|jgi:large subunit ribosomal protein L25
MNVIKVDKRDFTVKAKHLRRSGIVPGSVFGGSLPDSISLQMDEATACKLVRYKREGSKLKLDLDGQIIPVQVKEKTVNTLNGEILHISFQALKADQKVNSVIHIILKNTEKITDSLEKMLLEIPYTSLPENMIDTITINVDGMAVGSIITVGDIPELKSEKIELLIDAEEIVLRISDKKRTAEKEVEQEAE